MERGEGGSGGGGEGESGGGGEVGWEHTQLLLVPHKSLPIVLWSNGTSPNNSTLITHADPHILSVLSHPVAVPFFACSMHGTQEDPAALLTHTNTAACNATIDLAIRCCMP